MNNFIISGFTLTYTIKPTSAWSFIEEQFRLIKAENLDLALKTAEELFRQEATWLDTQQIGNYPAICKFFSINKYYPILATPSDGSIIGYNLFKVDNNKLLKRLFQNKETQVTYLFDKDKSFESLLEPSENNLLICNNIETIESCYCAHIFFLILDIKGKVFKPPWYICEIMLLINNIEDKWSWKTTEYKTKEKLKNIKNLNKIYNFNNNKVRLVYGGIKCFSYVWSLDMNVENFMDDKTELAYSVFIYKNNLILEKLKCKEGAKLIYRWH